jgi:hypothetical protein
MLSSPQANRFMPGSDTAVIVNAVNLDAYSDAIAGHDPWLRRWFRDHWKSPIVSSALREARGEAIIQGANRPGRD